MTTPTNDFWQTLFSLGGRSGRKRFWQTALLQFVSALVLGGVVVAASTDELVWVSIPLGALLILGSFALSLCNCVKRLHDIGFSGWWMALLFFVSLFFSLGSVFASDVDGGAANIGAGFNLICLILLGSLPGTQGPNRYGDPPGQTAAEPPEQAAA